MIDTDLLERLRDGGEVKGLFERRRTTKLHESVRLRRIKSEKADKANNRHTLSERIRVYNDSVILDAFKIYCNNTQTTDGGQVGDVCSYRGVLRFYLDGADVIEGKDRLVKAVRLSSQTSVRDLVSMLDDKFNLDDNGFKQYDRRIVRVSESGDEFPLSNEDYPLQVALNNCRSRFLLRLTGRKPLLLHPSLALPRNRSDLAASRTSSSSLEWRKYLPKSSPERSTCDESRSPTAKASRHRSVRLPSPLSPSRMFRRTASHRPKATAEPPAPNAELSIDETAPGVIRVFGETISLGANYKSVLACDRSTAREIVKEALERYGISALNAGDYVLCDVVGKERDDQDVSGTWSQISSRLVGDHERPLILQSLWKPREGLRRRFEIQRRSDVIMCHETDTITSGINANARKMLILQTDRKAMPNITDLPLKGFRNNLCKYLSTPDLCHDVLVDKASTSSNSHDSFLSYRAPAYYPYFLTLRGVDNARDRVLYVFHARVSLVCNEHDVTGQSDEIQRVLLRGPDILARHCWVGCDVTTNPNRGSTNSLCRAEIYEVYVKPLPSALVLVNGSRVDTRTALKQGDLITIGEHYVFLFKNPTTANQIPLNLPWLRPAFVPDALSDPIQRTTSLRATTSAPISREEEWRRKLELEYAQDNERLKLPFGVAEEDNLIDAILVCVEKSESQLIVLTPALCLAMMLDFACTKLSGPSLVQLLDKMTSRVLEKATTCAKEIPYKEDLRRSEISAGFPLISDVIRDVEPVVVWLANGLELYHFVRSMTSSFPAEQCSRMDEAVGRLEGTVVFCFQQTIYYLTKDLYLALTSVLDSNPFADDTDRAQVHVARTRSTIQGVLEIFKHAWLMFHRCQLHADLVKNLFSYLFFFVSTCLVNALMEKDAGHKYYKWSKGVQIRGNLDILDAWSNEHQLGVEAALHLKKINSVADLLATPKLQLLQADWTSLCRDFPELSIAQLNKILSEYQLGADRHRPEHWTPHIKQLEELRDMKLVNSYKNHPPMLFPIFGYKLNLRLNGNEMIDQRFMTFLAKFRRHHGSLDDDVDSGLSVSQSQSPDLTVDQSPRDTADSSALIGCEQSPEDGEKMVAVMSRAPGSSVKQRTDSYRAAFDSHGAYLRPKIARGPQHFYRTSLYESTESCLSDSSMAATPSADTIPRTQAKQATAPDKTVVVRSASRAGSAQPDLTIGVTAERRSLPRLKSASMPRVKLGANQTKPRIPERTDSLTRRVNIALSPRACESPRLRTCANNSRNSSDLIDSRSTTPRTYHSSNSLSQTNNNNARSRTASKVDKSVSEPNIQPDYREMGHKNELQSPIAPDPVTDVRIHTPLPGNELTSERDVAAGSTQATSKVSDVRAKSPSLGLRALPLTEEVKRTLDRNCSISSPCSEYSDNDSVKQTVYVNLDKGDQGLGLGLVDGLYSALSRSGIYVRTVVAGSTADRDGQIRAGDRLVSVNGTSLVGADYHSAMNLIRTAGRRIRLRVERGGEEDAQKITLATPRAKVTISPQTDDVNF